MKKIIIEVGSTVTKFDKCDGKNIERIGSKTIEFKKNYKKDNKLADTDIKTLIDSVKELQKEYKDIYVCGTSIFRSLTEKQKKEFLDTFYNETKVVFEIIEAVRENELTVLGATRNVLGSVAVLVGGGGSTEISIYDSGIKEMVNSEIGVIDIMNKYPDLADDFATTDIGEVKKTIREKLRLPKQKVEALILAGGGHLYFALNSGMSYKENTLYSDKLHPIIMDIETRIKDTERYYKEISLDEIRKRVDDPTWWYATRAMCAFALVVAEELGAKYIVPTDISMVNGLI
jgi:flagellar hook-associated protein FlgK